MALSREIFPGVSVGGAVLHDIPVLSSTRIPVQLIVGQLAGGESIEAVMDAYVLTEDQVRAALAYAADVLSRETLYALPGQ